MQPSVPPNPYRNARFVGSAARLVQLPPDSGNEVAFAGRSNAGKSSALNAIADNRNLARTSKTPGRTQLINLFAVDEAHRLVDLPGYGYAKVPEAMKLAWGELMAQYLRVRQSLRGLILVMDVRHPLKPFDAQMLGWCAQAGMPVHVLLTKADKLGRGEASATLQQVRKELGGRGAPVTVQLFSATSGQGVEEARAVLDGWMQWPGEGI